MRARWFPCWTLLGLLILPAVARPGDAKEEAAPTLILRIRSIDTVIENAKLIATLAGKEEFGPQIEGLIKTKVGPKGLEGIDTRRPLGVYTHLGEDLSDAAVIVLVPIADERAFLGLLENLNFKAAKNKDGTYTIQQDNVPVEIGFRFAHKYAYFTALNLSALDKDKLLTPASVFPRNLTADVSGSLRLDQLPKLVKDQALAKFEEELAKAKDKREPNETDAQHNARIATLDVFAQQFKEVLQNGRQVAGQLDLDREKKTLAVELSLDARPKSTLSKDIKQLGDSKSLFGGLLAKDQAVNALLHVTLPREVRKALEPVFAESISQAVAKETNEKKREQVEKFLKALEPSLKSGELDGAFSLRGPGTGNHYTLVAGIKIHKGSTLEQVVREVLKDLPATEKDKIKFEVDAVGEVKIHRVDAQHSFDKDARAAFGNNPVYVAFREDAVLVSLGEDGLDAIKEAIKAEPRASPPFVFDLSMARLARTIAKTDEQRRVVREVFSKGDPGLIRMSLEGGTTLRLRFSTDLSVLRFAAAFSQQRGAIEPSPALKDKQ